MYEDVYCSSTVLEAAKRGDPTSDNTLLMLSIDGTQLFESKPSDCWIYIWVLLDLAPDLRYKTRYVLPGGFIPGPNKPKNLDSFLYSILVSITCVLYKLMVSASGILSKVKHLLHTLSFS